MITDLTRPAQRKAAFGLLYLGRNLGVAVGPLIAGFLFNRYLVWFFLGDAATTLAAVVLIALFVRESAPSREMVDRSLAEEASPERAEKGSLAAVLRLTGRLAPALTVALSGLFFAAGFGMIGLVRTLPWLLLSTVIWTVGEILGATSASAYIANHSPMTHRARVNSIAPLIMLSGEAIDPPLAGRLIERASPNAIWPWTFWLSLAASALLALLYWRERAKAREAAGRAVAPCR